MELFQLRYFLEASRAKSFSQAAKRCFTSRQNLTHSVRSLERELGVQLFHIVKNVPVLTVEGQRAVGFASDVLAAADRMEAAFEKQVDPSQLPTLKLACGLNMRYASDGVLDALSCVSGMRLLVDELTFATCCHRVIDGHSDAALVYSMEQGEEGCESLVLGSSPLRVLASGDCALAHAVNPSLCDLAGYDVLLMPEPKHMYKRFLDAYNGCGLDSDRIRSMADYNHMLETVERGGAIAIVSGHFPQYIPDNMVAIDLSDMQLTWNLLLLYRKGTEQIDLIRKLVDHLVSQLPIDDLWG